MRKIIVKAAREATVSALGHDYCAYFEGQEDANRYGYGQTPQKAKRELLLSQEVMETSKGASISVWTTSGHVKVWAYTNGAGQRALRCVRGRSERSWRSCSSEGRPYEICCLRGSGNQARCPCAGSDPLQR